jgi:hypothetical protein
VVLLAEAGTLGSGTTSAEVSWPEAEPSLAGTAWNAIMLVNPAFSRKHPLDLNNWLHKLYTREICNRHSPFSEQTDTGNVGQTTLG